MYFNDRKRKIKW